MCLAHACACWCTILWQVCVLTLAHVCADVLPLRHVCVLKCYTLAHVCADVLPYGTCVCWCVTLPHVYVLMCYPGMCVCVCVCVYLCYPLACVCADVLYSGTCVCWCVTLRHVCVPMYYPHDPPQLALCKPNYVQLMNFMLLESRCSDWVADCPT